MYGLWLSPLKCCLLHPVPVPLCVDDDCRTPHNIHRNNNAPFLPPSVPTMKLLPPTPSHASAPLEQCCTPATGIACHPEMCQYGFALHCMCTEWGATTCPARETTPLSYVCVTGSALAMHAHKECRQTTTHNANPSCRQTILVPSCKTANALLPPRSHHVQMTINACVRSEVQRT